MTGDWLFWCLAGLMTIYGLALQWWAVLANREIHGRRCPRCWYDMSGAKGRRCPECGREFRHESQLHRRPPRIKAFGLGLAMLVAAGFCGKAAKDGFMDMVPTTFLTMLAPMSIGKQGAIEKELDERLREGRLSGAQLASIVERWIDADAPPWTFEIATRPSWSTEDPLHVAVRFDYRPTGLAWLDVWDYRLRLVPKLDPGRALVIRDGRWDEPFTAVESELQSAAGRSIHADLDWPDDWRRFTAALAAPPAGATSVEFEATVEVGTRSRRPARPGRAGPPAMVTFTPVTTQTVTLPIRTSAGAAESMPRRPLPEATTVSEYLGLTIESSRVGGRRGSDVPFAVHRRLAPHVRPMDGVVVALKVDLLLDDQVVASAPFAWEESPTLETFVSPVTLEWTEATVDLREVAERDRDRWRVRVRANPGHALRFFDADASLHFDGEVDVPISW